MNANTLVQVTLCHVLTPVGN